MWKPWRAHFEANAARPIPDGLSPVEIDEGVPEELRAVLLLSLVRFQLGETGEGRIAREIDRAQLAAVDDDYRAALKLFVREEGRHANILARSIRALGGELLQEDWTADLFTASRGLLGVRLKLLVLWAAEVVSLSSYEAVASGLGPGPLRAALAQVAADERAHLRFHTAFFRAHLEGRPVARVAAAGGLALVATTACVLLQLSHRRLTRRLPGGGRRMGARQARVIAMTVRDVVATRVRPVATPAPSHP